MFVGFINMGIFGDFGEIRFSGMLEVEVGLLWVEEWLRYWGEGDVSYRSFFYKGWMRFENVFRRGRVVVVVCVFVCVMEKINVGVGRLFGDVGVKL